MFQVARLRFVDTRSSLVYETYLIRGEKAMLSNGTHEAQAEPGSPSRADVPPERDKRGR